MNLIFKYFKFKKNLKYYLNKMSQFETNQQLARCGLSSQDLSVRSPFDQSYLQQYNTLSQNAQTYPSDNVQNMPRLSPFEQNVRENYAKARQVHTQVKHLTNPYSQCMGCHSIHNAEQNRSTFDQQYLDTYNKLAKNASAYPAIDSDKNPPLTPFMPCHNLPYIHCPASKPRHLPPHSRPSPGPRHLPPHSRPSPGPRHLPPHSRPSPGPRHLPPHSRPSPSLPFLSLPDSDSTTPCVAECNAAEETSACVRACNAAEETACRDACVRACEADGVARACVARTK